MLIAGMQHEKRTKTKCSQALKRGAAATNTGWTWQNNPERIYKKAKRSLLHLGQLFQSGKHFYKQISDTRLNANAARGIIPLF
ncbi:MAG: hypothetical protein B6D41_00855 [Chloroflexi bacterium UTCFX4]|nr:MAG: hypothetical protein B6D41_00855 [Chloroflexi bacterium UTCFX4]